MSETSQTEKLKNLTVLGIVLAILGLGVSAYSLYHHIELKFFGDHSFVCNINETLSCDDVANSRYAEDPWGNPLGVYGMGYFLGLALLLGVSWFKEAYRREALQAYAAMAAIGVLTSIGLGALSHYAIGKLCPTCMVIYSINFLQFIVLWFCRDALPRGFTLKELWNGGWYGILALVFVIAGYQMLKPAPRHGPKLDIPQDVTQLEALKKQIESAQGNAALASLDARVSDAVKIDASAYSGLGEDFRKGSDDAKVKIVEFADFQCPACATASRVMRQMAGEYGDRILVVFKNYPLDSTCNSGMPRPMHPFACEAAVLSRCAGRYGKFWDLHNRLFDNQTKIDATSLLAWSKDVGLTDEQIKQCKESKDILAKIQDDIKQGSAAGLTGTPTLFFNGRKYNGPVDAEEIRRVIEALLQQ